MHRQERFQIVFSIIIGNAFLFSFYPIFQKLLIRWNMGDNSYCYLVIPVFIYICWEKRKEFSLGHFSWNPWGLVPVAVSISLMILGELGSVETVLYAGVWGCLVGILSVMYGTRLRNLWFALLILAFIIPLPAFINRMLTFHLKLAASSMAVLLLRLSQVSVLQNGNIIDLGMTQLQVVDACSGLRYFVPLVLMGLLLGYFYNKRFWQKIVLLLSVFPLSIIVNGVRIYLTGMLHIWGYPQLAENFFHDFSGWLVFMLAGAFLYAAAILIGKIGTVSEGGEKVKSIEFAMPLRKQTFATLILCLMFVGSGYAVQNIPSSMMTPERYSFSSFPMKLGQWEAKKNYLSAETLGYLWADDYISATFSRRDTINTIQLLIPYYEYQGAQRTAHTPQACMLGGGWDLIRSYNRQVRVSDNNDVNIEINLWHMGEARVLSAYFFYMRGRVLTNPWMNKLYLMWDAFAKHRTDGALVRIELFMTPGQTIESGNAILDEFLSLLWPELPKYVPI